MRLALYLLLGASVALAWLVARRRTEHRPIAWALSAALAAELGRAVVLEVVPPRLDPSAPPLAGAALLGRYVDRALWIAWPAALAAMSLRVLARRRSWPVAVGYVAAVVVLVVGYRALRFDALRKVYLAIELLSLAIGVGSLVTWYRRAWRRERAGLSVRVAGVLVAGHLAMIVTGPYRFGLFGQAWALAHVAYVAILSAVILLHVGALLIRDDA